MKYRCTTCDLVMDGIPDGAIELGSRHRGYRVNTYRFADGSTHNLRQLSLTLKQHTHLHKKNPKTSCDFCFPPPIIAEPNPPVVHVELVQEVQPPVPEPMVKEVNPEPDEIEDESELTSITALAAAFSRIKS